MGNSKSTVLPLGATPDSGNFVVESAPPNVGFLKRGVQPPSGVYIEVSDVLVVTAASSQTNEVLTVNYRILRFDGVLIHGQFTLNVPANRSVVSYSEPLAEGFLLSMSCRAAVAITRGQTFARAYLTKPSLGAGQPSYMLMADYVTTAMAPAHPNGRVLAPSEGPGFSRNILGTAPGVGLQIVLVVPTNARWAVRCGQALFTTGAFVANRVPGIFTLQAGNETYTGTAEVTIPANSSSTFTISSTRNVPAAGGLNIWCPFPIGLVLRGGDVIETVVIGMTSGDSWLAPVFGVEEWLDNV